MLLQARASSRRCSKPGPAAAGAGAGPGAGDRRTWGRGINAHQLRNLMHRTCRSRFNQAERQVYPNKISQNAILMLSRPRAEKNGTARARPVEPGRASSFSSRQSSKGRMKLRRQCERQNTHCHASSYTHSSQLGVPDCGTGGCPPGHTITMISNAFSYIHSSRFGGSRLWYRRLSPGSYHHT